MSPECRERASYVYVSRNVSFSENFPYILNEWPPMATFFLIFKDETDVELSSLLISECQSVFNQLILYLSVNREQVFQGFSILACNDPKYEGPKEFKTEADVVRAKKFYFSLNIVSSTLYWTNNHSRHIFGQQ